MQVNDRFELSTSHRLCAARDPPKWGCKVHDSKVEVLVETRRTLCCLRTPMTLTVLAIRSTTFTVLASKSFRNNNNFFLCDRQARPSCTQLRQNTEREHTYLLHSMFVPVHCTSHPPRITHVWYQAVDSFALSRHRLPIPPYKFVLQSHCEQSWQQPYELKSDRKPSSLESAAKPEFGTKIWLSRLLQRTQTFDQGEVMWAVIELNGTSVHYGEVIRVATELN